VLHDTSKLVSKQTFAHLKIDMRKKGESAQSDKSLDGSRGEDPYVYIHSNPN